jgi:hypothetical protein
MECTTLYTLVIDPETRIIMNVYFKIKNTSESDNLQLTIHGKKKQKHEH